ncbi:MAG: hypothetical protein Q4G25_15705 [Paracoccus sp. (in: a-proteobacteria)]|nr:hypothetical protein [Paracoccus sp. (in: a-proteobacteria)]
MFLGLLPAAFITLALHLGLTDALYIAAILVVIAALYHFFGWLLVFAPFHAARWLWRKVRGYQPPPAPPPAPAPPRFHWVLIAGFLCGMALMILLAIRDGL